jgi:hypothetical protein
MLVKDLLYTDKYTIEGARARVDEYRKNGELKSHARQALEAGTVESLERDLQRIAAALDGSDVEEPASGAELAEDEAVE